MRIALIPGKGSSKRIPKKNSRLFHGRPIIVYSIDVAKACGIFQEVYVSTEDKEMASLARSNGAKVVNRPEELTKDSVGTQEVTKHAIEALELKPDDTVCCIYATAPLLAPIDLQQAYGMLLYRPCSYVVSVGTEPLRDLGNFYMGFASRFLQDLPLWNTHTGIYPMPLNRAIDINVERDWKLAEAMYESLHGRKVGHA